MTHFILEYRVNCDVQPQYNFTFEFPQFPISPHMNIILGMSSLIQLFSELYFCPVKMYAKMKDDNFNSKSTLTLLKGQHISHSQ